MSLLKCSEPPLFPEERTINKVKIASVCIDAKTLKTAFNRAKQMLKSGDLSNRKALIERYVNSVTIYKDKIVIEFNVFDEFTVCETVSR